MIEQQAGAHAVVEFVIQREGRAEFDRRAEVAAVAARIEAGGEGRRDDPMVGELEIVGDAGIAVDRGIQRAHHAGEGVEHPELAARQIFEAGGHGGIFVLDDVVAADAEGEQVLVRGARGRGAERQGERRRTEERRDARAGRAQKRSDDRHMKFPSTGRRCRDRAPRAPGAGAECRRGLKG